MSFPAMPMKSVYCGPRGSNDGGRGGVRPSPSIAGEPARRLAPVGFVPQKEAGPLDFALS